MKFYTCTEHGYAYLPKDKNLYEVINPPPIDHEALCQECADIMWEREKDYPSFIGCKIWFNVTTDQTQRKLMLGRYTYLRFKLGVH